MKNLISNIGYVTMYGVCGLYNTTIRFVTGTRMRVEIGDRAI